MTSPVKVRSDLRTRFRPDEIVNIRRRSRPGYSIDGFVLAVGRSWVLLSKTTEGGHFDGYAAIRISDIKSVEPDRSFQSGYAKTRPEWPPSLPPLSAELDLDTTKGMLRSLLLAGHMIGIERDLRGDATWIGVPDGLTKKYLHLWEVTPQAAWHEAPLGYKLKTITTLIFDDQYQVALSAMAGSPPADATSDWVHNLQKRAEDRRTADPAPLNARTDSASALK